MSDIAVTREPLTYREDAPLSYFSDLLHAQHDGDVACRTRLERHARELRDEYERRDQQARSHKPDGVEFRANPDRTAGQGGSFAPPLWLIDRFATAPRAPRVLADLIPNFTLPQGVQSVNVPRLTTGLTAGVQNDLGVDPATDAVDAAVTSPVVTISGHGDVSLQVLDQSPPGAHLDFAFFKDLTESYNAQLELQLINGSNTNGQLAGLLNVVPSANQVTYTTGSPTATGMFTFLGQTVAKVGNNRKLPPECWVMTTSRLAWLGSSEDTQNRPLMLTDQDGSGDVDLLSFPVEMDDAVPTTLGAGSNQDVIIACRPSDSLLFESAPHLRVHFDVTSGVLQARIQLHRYAAALNGRYPTGTATLQGTGLVTASGF